LHRGCQTLLSRFNPDDACSACQAAEAAIPPPPPEPYVPPPPYWTPERIVTALQTWAGEFGHTPSRREWIASRRSPHHSTITKRMGSWTQALVDAGMEPRPPHRPKVLPRPGQTEAIMRLLAEGPSTVGDAMRAIGCRRDVAKMILERLEAQGVVRPYFDGVMADGRRRNVRWFLVEREAA